jgi:ferritin-like metal-binding protein YciE
MKPISNLRDLFIEQLKDRYDSEMQQIEAFPAMMEKASATELKRLILTSIRRSKMHLTKIEKFFYELGIDPVGDVCEGSISMINEAWKLMNRTTSPAVTDAALITSIQHIHHYDIAGYGTLSAYAKILGYDGMAMALHDMLEEEKNLDLSLKMMALSTINPNAVRNEVIV